MRRRGGEENRAGRAQSRMRRHRMELARHRRPGPRCRGAPALRLPPFRAVWTDPRDRVVGDRRRGGRHSGLFRRQGRSRFPARHRNLVVAAAALSADHHLVVPDAGLLHPAGDFAAVLMGVAGACGARGIPARAQFRICERRSGARSFRRQDHPAPSPAQRHGRDADISALYSQFLDHDADFAGFPGLRPAAGIAVAGRIAVAGQIQFAGALAWI